MNGTMKAAYLPGNSTVDLREIPIPTPGYGQVLVKMKASTICGSDIRAIYREHTGKGPEGYQDKVAGHEPCGQVIEEGPGVRRFKEGSRVIVYHISGCGLCHDCRMGYQISCSSPLRAAYGWQRDGGMEEYVVCDEKDLIELPDELTYTDGAQVACGFGTVYEGIEKIGISGNDAVLVTGLGPVGLATLMLARKLGANQLIGVENNPFRLELARKMGLADVLLDSNENTVDEIMEITHGNGVERAIDTSGADPARQIAIRATRAWGRIVLVGEGGSVHFNPSPDLMHGQKTIYGSWVTSLALMETLVEELVRWNLHPEDLVTNRFSIDDVSKAYELMDEGQCGKVAICFDEELK